MDFFNKAMEQAKQLQQIAADAAQKGYEQATPLVREGVAKAQELQKTIVEQTPQPDRRRAGAGQRGPAARRRLHRDQQELLEAGARGAAAPEHLRRSGEEGGRRDASARRSRRHRSRPNPRRRLRRLPRRARRGRNCDGVRIVVGQAEPALELPGRGDIDAEQHDARSDDDQRERGRVAGKARRTAHGTSRESGCASTMKPARADGMRAANQIRNAACPPRRRGRTAARSAAACSRGSSRRSRPLRAAARYGPDW